MSFPVSFSTSLTLSANQLASLCLLAWAGWSAPACAQNFAASVSPPRFELQVQPGQTSRQTLTIEHMGNATARYRIYTADWTLDPSGTVTFTEGLTPGSCRPWVAIEKRELSLAARARYRYRFEITPPADAPLRQCRFALMIEGLDPTLVRQGMVDMPISARVGVIVYANLPGTGAEMVINTMRVITHNGQSVPALEIHNRGTAHGRLDGFLSARASTGESYELVPSDVPILPDTTRLIPLLPTSATGQPAPALKFPLTVKGTLQLGAQRQPLEHQFTGP